MERLYIRLLEGREREKVMRNNPSYFKKGDNYPVEQVSWNDVQGFVQGYPTDSSSKNA